MSWADAVAERGISEVGVGGAGWSEDWGIGLQEVALWICTEEGAESDDEDGLLSKHNTWN